MMRLHVGLSFIAALAAAFPLSAQTTEAGPAVYRFRPDAPLTDSLDLSFDQDRARVSLRRTATDSVAARLLHHAESLYPAVLEANDNLAECGTLPVPLAGPRWWQSRCDLVREPYAVTAGAVRYYMAVVALFENPTRARHLFSKRDGRNGVRLGYVATAGPAGTDAPPNARYAVRLELRWEEPCSGLCGLQYRAYRVVYYDAAGQVLEISGDGRLIVVTG
jgi:hypothetical protein